MTIQARPQRNGNPAVHFRDAYDELNKAQRAVAGAFTTVRLNVTHGRNYQHLPGADANSGDLVLMDARERQALEALGAAMRDVLDVLNT